MEGNILQVERLPEDHQDRALLLPLRQELAALRQELVALRQKEVELAKQTTLQMEGTVPPTLTLGFCMVLVVRPSCCQSMISHSCPLPACAPCCPVVHLQRPQPRSPPPRNQVCVGVDGGVWV